MDYAGYNQDPSLSTLSKKTITLPPCVVPTVIADAQHRLTAGPGRDVPVLGTGRDQAFFHIPGPSHGLVKKPGPIPHQST